MLDHTYFWGGRSSCKRSFLAQHGTFDQDFPAMSRTSSSASASPKHGLEVVHARSAKSFMLRAGHLRRVRAAVREAGPRPVALQPAPRRSRRRALLPRRRGAREVALAGAVAGGEDGARPRAGAAPRRRGRARARATSTSSASSTAGPSRRCRRAGSPRPRRRPPQPDARLARGRRRARRRDSRDLPRPRVHHRLAEVGDEHPRLVARPAQRAVDRGGVGHLLLPAQGRAPRAAPSRPPSPGPTAPGSRNHGVDFEQFLAHLGLGLNALLTATSDGRRWVDQTPANTLVVDRLAEMFPGARFLHILRDGRRVVHSMVNFHRALADPETAERMKSAGRLPPWTTDFRDACRTWARFVAHRSGLLPPPSRALVHGHQRAPDHRPGGRDARGARVPRRAPRSPRRREFLRTHRINSSFAASGRSAAGAARADRAVAGVASRAAAASSARRRARRWSPAGSRPRPSCSPGARRPTASGCQRRRQGAKRGDPAPS